MEGNERERVLPPYWKVRYTKIHFRAELTEETEMVREKASALRGGMGEMLLRAHCVGHRECGSCGFAEECVVQRTMYSRFAQLPVSVHQGDSVGYVMYCPDSRKHFGEGDSFPFTLTLIGKNIVYFSLYLDALHALGLSGLGRNGSHYRIVSVKNLYGEQILEGNNIYMKNYKWQTLGDYVTWRRHRLGAVDGGLQLLFHAPVSMKHRGEFIHAFSGEAIAGGLVRRLNILSAFEGLLGDGAGYVPKEAFPEILSQRAQEAEVCRHSSRKDALVKLRGIKGFARFGEIPEEWLDALLAGEAVHLGRNTSFGFGKYTVEPWEGGKWEKYS